MPRKKNAPGGINRHLGADVPDLRRALEDHLVFTQGKDRYTATYRDWFVCAAHVLRDRLMTRWMETMRSYYQEDAKRVYYLSLEFLIGRTLENSLYNLGFHDAFQEALADMELDPDRLVRQEPDAALGNGGLGRLAACLLDSMATLQLPGYGYGIRYEYGMFTQRIENGDQVEHPDNWLRYGNPWEFPRPEVLYRVHFYGHSSPYVDPQGHTRFQWTDTEDVMAMAYDTPIPGYATDTVNNLRLWSAKATRDFHLSYFNRGDYIRAVEDKNESENLSKVLYPEDSTEMGRELRLKQQYFFVSASLQDILYRFSRHHEGFAELPDKVAIQLNDTHPAVAIPELMRILVDRHQLTWETAWDLTTRTFAYTNHTLLPEALETWPVPLFERVLPRHLQIIYEINRRFLDEVRHQHPGDGALLGRMSLIAEGEPKQVRMAHLAIVGSHRVNGVAALHARILRERVFPDFDRQFPGRFIGITNGITPRRWLHQANRPLAELLDEHLEPGWATDLERLQGLRPLAEDPAFREAFARVKTRNKQRLARVVHLRQDLDLDLESLFDVQVKRIHEYKRQLLNILQVIARYNRILDGEDPVPRTVVFAGKAAPGYVLAKNVIALILGVADVVNRHPRSRERLRVVFMANYDVTSAERIIPAADLSQQISTAGTEASGTGNMKLALNGALTLGTLDGANIEIMEAVGRENLFTFGLDAEAVEQRRAQGHDPQALYRESPELRRVLDMIAEGYFSAGDPERYRPVLDALLHHGDRYLVLADFAAYLEAQGAVDALYRDPAQWQRRAILNVAGMGRFSSDRTIAEYAREVWGAEPVRR